MQRESYGRLDKAFWERKPLVGMVHLLPLPGSARDSGEGMEAVLERAIADAKGTSFYEPTEEGAEARIKARMENRKSASDKQ